MDEPGPSEADGGAESVHLSGGLQGDAGQGPGGPRLHEQTLPQPQRPRLPKQRPQQGAAAGRHIHDL